MHCLREIQLSISLACAEAAAPDFRKHLEQLLQVIYPLSSLAPPPPPCLHYPPLFGHIKPDGTENTRWTSPPPTEHLGVA